MEFGFVYCSVIALGPQKVQLYWNHWSCACLWQQGTGDTFFLEHVARNINPFLWEMLCKDDSSKCLGNIVLMERRWERSGLRTTLISSSHLWLSEATILRLSPSLLPHYRLNFEHHVCHQAQEHPGTLQSLHMGEIRTWKRKPADLHGIQAGWSCVTGQSSSNLLLDSKVEGICASAFKYLQEILATLFDAGCSY